MTAHVGSDSILSRVDHHGVARLTLNNPARRNSLSEAMLDGLANGLAAISSDRSVRVVILAASGPVFSAGHDLKELTAHRGDADRGRAYFADIMGRCAALMQAIVPLPQPVIAEVPGLRPPAGCQLVASCDLAIASEEAQFCTPGVYIGLFCSTPMVALSRNVAAKHAMEMLLTGDMIAAARRGASASSTASWPAGMLKEEATALARRIAASAASTHQDRQGSLLPSARDAARRGLCLCRLGHGREHAGARRRGRHRCFP